MKKLKNIYKILAVLLLIAACTDSDLRDLSFLDRMSAPSNLEMVYNITQDNTGAVTISPNADGASTFDVFFGDSTPEPMRIPQGENANHVYAEGQYDVKVIAYNTNGDATEMSKPLTVSFRAPENLVVTLDNDAAISKQVNVNATAEFATMYEFYSGEETVTQPVATANIGEALSYQYATAGTYSVKVIAKGGAIETTEYAVDFEVTEILAPTAAATTPPNRNAEDVVSIFSDAYTDVTLDELPTGWSASSFESVAIGSDNVWKLSNIDFIGMVTNYANGIDVAAMEKLHIDYWVPSGISNGLSVKIVNTVDGGEAVASLGATVAGTWQSIDIDMTDFDGGNLANKNKITQILIDSDGTAGVLYIDNFYFYKAPSSIVTSLVQDFEGAAPSIIPFGNAAAAIISNPDATGANTTANVVEFTKTAGAEVWAGATLALTTPLDLVNFPKLILKTWSPKVGAVVKVKIENADASIVYEVDVNTTVANSWEDLTYDFSGAPAADYVKVVVFFDFGNSGDGSVYYYDEINLLDDSGVVADLSFQDFEGAAPTITPFGNAAAAIISNPDATGANTTATVVEFTKATGAEVWAGATLDVTTPLDFTNYSKIGIKTWSPKVGAVVKVKLENSDASIVYEVDVNTTVANSWEDLTYDFSTAPAADYVKVVVFFDFGNSGDGSVYYYDELKLTN
jgi:hypothetical protein